MKKVLVLVTVIALAASMSPATTTLEVWTTLVSATPSAYHAGTVNGFTFGTDPVPVGPNMALGYYGVQIWAQIIGGTDGDGISDMAVTLYTPDTNGAFTPVPMAWPPPGEGVPPIGLQSYGDAVSAYNQVKPAVQNWTNALNPESGLDTVQLGIGDTAYSAPNLAVDSPVLIATEAWNLTSLATPITLGVYVEPTSRHWADTKQPDGTYKQAFDSVVGQGMVIPEPITMTMLGMGLSSLGMMVWRRRKEKV